MLTADGQCNLSDKYNIIGTVSTLGYSVCEDLDKFYAVVSVARTVMAHET